MLSNGALDTRRDIGDAVHAGVALLEPALSATAQAILAKRFLVQAGDGPPETARERLWSIASEAARGSAAYESEQAQARRRRDYYLTMARLELLPSALTLAGVGRGESADTAVAGVLPAPETVDELLETIQRVVRLQRRGSGIGISLSRLGSRTGLDATPAHENIGPLKALELISAAAQLTQPDGVRAGALAVLSVDHPGILSFIDCTRELDSRGRGAFEAAAPYLGPGQRSLLKQALVEGQQISIGRAVSCTDRFMVALVRGEEYELLEPKTRQIVGKLPAREVFARLVASALASDELGVVFLDRINAGRANPVPKLGPIDAVVPTGEALYPDEAFAAGYLNLARFCRPVAPRNGHVSSPNGLNGNGSSACHAGFTRHPAVDWERLGKATRLAIRFLDDLVSATAPTDATVAATRRLGVGVMGWADLLVMLEIAYESQAALELAEEVMGFVDATARDESCNLADERGAFAEWPNSRHKDGRPRRNATVTSLASTGPISIIAGCTGGIEPLPSLVVERRAGSGEPSAPQVHPLLEETARREGFWTDELPEQIRSGGIRGIEGVPEHWQRVFATASDLSPECHIRMQAAFQRHTDNAVAKTIGLPREATAEDVERAYRLAYETGCHGLTLYRRGSNAGSTRADVADHGGLTSSGAGGMAEQLRARPQMLQGLTYQQETPLGTAYVTINLDEQQQPFEVFVNQGKTGSDVAALSVAIGKLASLALRLPSAMTPTQRLREVARRLRGIGGSSSWGFGPDRARSLPDALARVLDTYLEHQPTSAAGHSNDAVVEAVPSAQLALPLAPTGEFCPDCSNGLVFQEGAAKCLHCGLAR